MFRRRAGRAAAAVAHRHPDWGVAARLEAERESLGLYLSGHPFDQYRSDGPSSPPARCGSDQRRRPKSNGEGWRRGREVSVAGLVTGLRKRGGRVTFDLDDGRERVEVTLFQEAFEQFRHLLVSHAIVVISGKLRFDDFIGGWRLTAREVMDIDRLVEDRASGLVIRWCRREGRVLGSRPAARDPGPLPARALRRQPVRGARPMPRRGCASATDWSYVPVANCGNACRPSWAPRAIDFSTTRHHRRSEAACLAVICV